MSDDPKQWLAWFEQIKGEMGCPDTLRMRIDNRDHNFSYEILLDDAVVQRGSRGDEDGITEESIRAQMQTVMQSLPKK